jgi:hypothetical protein
MEEEDRSAGPIVVVMQRQIIKLAEHGGSSSSGEKHCFSDIPSVNLPVDWSYSA